MKGVLKSEEQSYLSRWAGRVEIFPWEAHAKPQTRDLALYKRGTLGDLLRLEDWLPLPVRELQAQICTGQRESRRAPSGMPFSKNRGIKASNVICFILGTAGVVGGLEVWLELLRPSGGYSGTSKVC